MALAQRLSLDQLRSLRLDIFKESGNLPERCSAKVFRSFWSRGCVCESRRFWRMDDDLFCCFFTYMVNVYRFDDIDGIFTYSRLIEGPQSLLTPHHGAPIWTAATCVVVRRLVNQLLSSLGDALTAAKQVRPLPLEDWVLWKDEKNELRDVTVTELHDKYTVVISLVPLFFF